MKKSFLSILLFLTTGFCLFAQNFTEVSRSNAGQQVVLSQDQVLEVKLPSQASTGYGWYLKNATRQNIVKQIGDFEFVSSTPENAVGAPGTQVTRFIGSGSGTADIELVYIRPWETDVEPLDAYKVTVISEGNYTGSYKPATYQDVAAYTPSRALPASFSLQAQCTSVKNQGSCGSCWAFAACGSFEANLKIIDRKDLDLSEQWMVNCDKKSQGCSGGYCPNYLFKQNGAVYEANAPYQGKNGTCATYTYHEKIDNYMNIANNVDAIKQAIMNYGPVWSTVYASGSGFQGYKSGVLTTNEKGSKPNDHAIVLCGWDDATSSWVLRNSWGASYGTAGYMKIKYGVNGVGEATVALVYKGGISGVANIERNAAVNIYPNPAVNGIFNINGLEKENTIEVYDVVGKLIYKTLTTNTATTVDLSGNKKGIYLYKVINADNSVKQGKVVIM